MSVCRRRLDSSFFQCKGLLWFELLCGIKNWLPHFISILFSLLAGEIVQCRVTYGLVLVFTDVVAAVECYLYVFCQPPHSFRTHLARYTRCSTCCEMTQCVTAIQHSVFSCSRRWHMQATARWICPGDWAEMVENVERNRRRFWQKLEQLYHSCSRFASLSGIRLQLSGLLKTF